MDDDGRWLAHALFDQLATPSLVIDRACVVVAANAAAVALLGTERAELIGSPLVERWRAHDYERLHRAASSLLQTPGHRVVMEWVRLAGRDDEWMVVTVAMTSLEGGTTPLMLCEVIPTVSPSRD